ncbi:hypothetical protein BCV70DRAFT_201919 [Testicularia cyperi]|uniref:Uncharacterized protein n=1 Tax=Testicularia cyperi TaxID=1882483 RepID=A0A317XMK0_9BASI|nr:hypothetical protein BCV70DRAFT_201919 [Testicularia cyperi]
MLAKTFVALCLASLAVVRAAPLTDEETMSSAMIPSKQVWGQYCAIGGRGQHDNPFLCFETTQGSIYDGIDYGHSEFLAWATRSGRKFAFICDSYDTKYMTRGNVQLHADEYTNERNQKCCRFQTKRLSDDAVLSQGASCLGDRPRTFRYPQ